MSMTATQVKDLITSLWTRVGSNRVDDADLRTVGNAIVDLVSALEIEIFPDWTSGLTFQTDGTDDGRYCKYPDTDFKKRIFETKVDDNIGNAPPTDPLISETTEWKEISQSAKSAIEEWGPGVFGVGLIIVYYDFAPGGIPDPGFYKLNEPVRPFTSTNLATELVAEQWIRVGGSGGGGLVKPISETYADVATLIADQGNQEEDEWYMVTDASTDTTVTTGWGIYRYLGTTIGDLTDYQKVLEQESLDVVINDASSSVKGIMKKYSTLSGGETDGAPDVATVKAAIDAINNRFNVGGMGLSM